MKAIVHKTDGHRGFITSTIVPANRSQEPRFGLLDAFLIVALLLGTAAVMRFILAH
jgi:hypothetical protein